MHIIIHGPLEKEFLTKNLRAINKSLPQSTVILSIYKKDSDALNKMLKKDFLDYKVRIEIIESDDVFNPGFYNINRQINLVKAAIDSIEDNDTYILKVRMDQCIDYKSMLKIYKKHKDILMDKIVSTNCYTRKDRLYHPSDMFLAGTKKNLAAYYPKSFFPESHMDCQLRIQELVRQNETERLHYFWPESRLFINYLQEVGDKEVLDTYEDSESKLKKHIFLINSWDIKLKWMKFLKGKFTVLPYFFEMRPFHDGPLEKAENFLASELNGYRNIVKEKCMNLLSKAYFRSGMYIINPVFIDFRSTLIRFLRRCFNASFKFIPPILHNLVYRVAKRVYYALR